MYDYKIIKDGDKLYSVDRCNELFDKNLSFISASLRKSNQENNIDVTHHVPIFQYYSKEYLDSYINKAYSTDLVRFI